MRIPKIVIATGFHLNGDKKFALLNDQVNFCFAIAIILMKDMEAFGLIKGSSALLSLLTKVVGNGHSNRFVRTV